MEREGRPCRRWRRRLLLTRSALARELCRREERRQRTSDFQADHGPARGFDGEAMEWKPANRAASRPLMDRRGITPRSWILDPARSVRKASALGLTCFSPSRW